MRPANAEATTTIALVSAAPELSCNGCATYGGGGGGTCNGGTVAACTVTLAGSAPAYTVGVHNNAQNGGGGGGNISTTFQLDLSGSFDPDNANGCGANQPLSYTATVVSVPAGAAADAIALTWNGTVDPWVTLRAFGAYRVRVQVSDGTHTSSPVYVQINYTNN